MRNELRDVEASPPLPADRRAAVRARLEAHAARHRVAGWQYLVVTEDAVLVEECGGTTDAARAIPVTPASTFNAYSITKPFVATAVMMAARAGALDLEAPIAVPAVMPQLARFGSVRQTLVHSAGFPNPLPLRWVHRADEDLQFNERAFVEARLHEIASHRPHIGRMAYSNLGYLALGRALAVALRVEDDNVRVALLRHLIRPLLSDTTLSGAALDFTISAPHDHARGHLPRHGAIDLLLSCLVDRRALVEDRSPRDVRWTRLRLHQVHGSAYGGLMANARGLASFGRALLGVGNVLDAALCTELVAPVLATGGARSPALFSGIVDGERWLAHAGGGLGGYGELRVYPARRVVSVLLTTAVGLRDHRWLDDLDRPWRSISPQPPGR